MKRVFIIAAVLIAALPMAQASTYLFTSGTAGTSEITTGDGIYPITVWGYTYATLATVSGVSSLSGGALSSLSYSSSYGLGVGATCNDIVVKGACGSLGSYVVVDFADASPSPGGPELNGATAATIRIDNADSGWTIYGTNAAPGTSGISGLHSLATFSGASLGNVYNQNVSFSGYSYLVITAGPTCELNVLSISTNVPEPGTFVMAGMALIGLGVALRKVCKR
ncbi:MAG: PEP-CTERM sorting domain-containing protein [Bryobacteraceae bacterium]